MRDGVSHAVTFVGGLLLGVLLTGGLFGSYLVFGHARQEAMRAEMEAILAMRARDEAEMHHQRARLEEARAMEQQGQAEKKLRDAEARIQELEQQLNKKP